MEVRKFMKQPVHSVKPLDSIQHARDLMANNRVNQLPVVVDGRLVGIVTDRDLRDAFPSVFDSPPFRRQKPKVAGTDPRTVTVELVMSPTVTSIAPRDSLAEAARVMRKQRIGALPVIEKDRVVGILARSDILDAFVDILELEESREAGSLVRQPESKPAGKKRKTASRSRRSA